MKLGKEAGCLQRKPPCIVSYRPLIRLLSARRRLRWSGQVVSAAWGEATIVDGFYQGVAANDLDQFPW